MQDKTPRNEQGAAHGYWEIYHDNGQLQWKGLYINNKRFGKFEWFFDDFSYDTNYINDENYGYNEYKYKNEKEYIAR